MREEGFTNAAVVFRLSKPVPIFEVEENHVPLLAFGSVGRSSDLGSGWSLRTHFLSTGEAVP